MSARLSRNQRIARGHRPRLQCRIQFVHTFIDRAYSSRVRLFPQPAGAMRSYRLAIFDSVTVARPRGSPVPNLAPTPSTDPVLSNWANKPSTTAHRTLLWTHFDRGHDPNHLSPRNVGRTEAESEVGSS